MRKIILNERVYVEGLLASPSLDDGVTETITRVARYYHSEGYKKEEIIGLIEDYMIRCNPNINIVSWQTLIDKISASAGKYPLVDIQAVHITQSEIEKIKALTGIVAQRFMFTALCLAKYGDALSPNNNGWVNRADSEIFRLANTTLNTKRQGLLINDLWTLGYVGYSKVVDNINIQIKIVDDDSPIVLSVTDFRNLGYQYMRILDPAGFIECRECGLVVKRRSRGHKYCDACAIEVKRHQDYTAYHSERDPDVTK